MTVDGARRWLRSVNEGVMATTRPGTRQLVVYLSSLLAMYLVTMVSGVAGGTVSITYHVLDGHGVTGTASFPLHAIVEIVVFGPVLSIVMLSCFKKYVASCEAKGMMSPRKAIALETLLVIAICLLATGLVTNRLFNVASAQAKAFHGSTGTGWENYMHAYFLDEIVGHHLMNAGFVLYHAVMALVLPIGRHGVHHGTGTVTGIATGTVTGNGLGNGLAQWHELNGGERLLVAITSAVHGLLFSIENLEGQSLPFIGVLAGGIAGVLLLTTVARKGDIPLSSRPFLLFMVVSLAVMAAFALVWGLVLGTKAWYPFLYQPSEL